MSFSLGQQVKLAIDGEIDGVVVELLPAVAGMGRYRVFHGGGNVSVYYEDQLEVCDCHSVRETIGVGRLLELYACRKLWASGSTEPLMLGSGKIKFIPFQFRPLRKLLNSDRHRILVADEVGVGKTIESGIILKELEKRGMANTVAIVCPKELAEKWRQEMMGKFGLRFDVLDSASLDYCVREAELEDEWPREYSRCILGLEMLRMEENLARLERLASLEYFEGLDLMILDEAHHVVNPSSKSHCTANRLAECSSAAVFLSATPIQLKSHDLFVLLNLLQPEEFFDEGHFNAVAEPNAHVNAAIRAVRNPADPRWRRNALDALAAIPKTNDWSEERFGGNKLLEHWTSRLADQTSTLGAEDRIALLRDLEDLHTFSHVINRTKRRDIGAFTTRDPVTVVTSYCPAERQFYDAARDFENEVLTLLHGSAAAKFIMANIERYITSCLPAFAQVLDSIVERGLASVAEYSEQDDLDEEDVLPGGNWPHAEMTLRDKAEQLRTYAGALPGDDDKSRQLLRIVEDALRSGDGGKTLVFAYFKGTLRYLQPKLCAAGIRCAIVSGDIPMEERRALRDRFRLPSDNPLALDVLLSSEVGCEGLDYEFCSRLVNYDIPWNPMKIEQRIGRIDRYGQKSPKVRIFNFVTEDTVECRIFHRCFERLGVFSSTIGDLEGVLGRIQADLTASALTLDLDPCQQVARANQLIDNAIRLREEQALLEDDSRDLFLLDLNREDRTANQERGTQMELLRHLVATCLARICPKATVTKESPSRLRCRLAPSDKRSLAHRLETLGRGRRTDGENTERRRLEKYLTSDAQVVSLCFDGTDDIDDQALYVSVTHPLAELALSTADTSASPAAPVAHLQCDCPGLAEGDYLFCLYEWEQRGYRTSTEIAATLLEASTGDELPVSLADLEQVLLSCKDRVDVPVFDDDTVDLLDSAIYLRQRKAKERLAEVNEDEIRRRIVSANRAYGSRVNEHERIMQDLNDPKVTRMHKAQAERLRSKWDALVNELNARMASDILVTPLVYGTLRISQAGTVMGQ